MSSWITFAPHRSGVSSRDVADTEFHTFVADHVEALLRTAYLVVWDASDAEDLVQECLVKVHGRWSRVRGMEQPVAYARRVLINLAVDDRRAKTRARRHSLDADNAALAATLHDPAGGQLTGVDDRVALERALADLPPRQRAVLVLRFFDDLTEADVARTLGWPVGTVKSTAARGLDRLRLAFAGPTSSSPTSPSSAAVAADRMGVRTPSDDAVPPDRSTPEPVAMPQGGFIDG
jgi:RNA polymerase sigma-70 factor (sigma-E family)